MKKKLKRKTIFKRYLIISISIILIGFTLIGIMLVLSVMQYSQNEKQELLSDNAGYIADLVSEYYDIVDEKLTLEFPVDNWRSIILTIAKSLNAEIFVTDTDGNIIITSNYRSGCNKISNDIMAIALYQKYFENGKLGGVYNDMHLTVGIPITVDGDQKKNNAGVVFLSTEASSTFYIAEKIVRIFIMASLMTFVIMVCLIGLFTYNMVRPLSDMAEAAKRFSKGDFSSRVLIKRNDEIGQLAEEFNNMADSLALSEGTRRSFIANVSHELKTPMTTIGGFVDGILDGTISSDKQSYYLNIVSAEVKRLSRLVQSMLALSRIDSRTLKPSKQKFNLTEVIIETLISFEQKIVQKNINMYGLDNIAEINIDGDKDMLHQVVYNLFENAVKFTNENGYIKISAKLEPNRTIINIENSCNGINSEEIKHIFERFYKTDKSRSRDKNGMGLGLYIVKTILQIHGGGIIADSEVGKNCRFTFWLPSENIKKQEKVNRIEKSRKYGKENKDG